MSNSWKKTPPILSLISVKPADSGDDCSHLDRMQRWSLLGIKNESFNINVGTFKGRSRRSQALLCVQWRISSLCFMMTSLDILPAPCSVYVFRFFTFILDGDLSIYKPDSSQNPKLWALLFSHDITLYCMLLGSSSLKPKTLWGANRCAARC